VPEERLRFFSFNADHSSLSSELPVQAHTSAFLTTSMFRTKRELERAAHISGVHLS
jgi:hypothetical protein